MITICSVVIQAAISRNTFDTIYKYVCTIGARRRLECDSAEYEWYEVALVSAGWSGVVAAQPGNWRSNMCQNLSKTLKTRQTIQHTTLHCATPRHTSPQPPAVTLSVQIMGGTVCHSVKYNKGYTHVFSSIAVAFFSVLVSNHMYDV